MLDGGAQDKLREAACNVVAGGSAGVISATVLCPLDVIKTRLQVYGIPSNLSSDAPPAGRVIISGFQQILKKEGLPGLYRGLSPTIVALFPTWAVTFSVYNHIKGLLHSKDGNDGELSVQANVLAASCAGIATATATNPLWVVKTRLQTQGMRPGVVPYQSISSALQRIAKEEGIRGLYSGILPSLVGVAHVAIQLPVYEKVKLYFAKRDNATVDNLSATQIAICSSGSKVAASIITYPHEGEAAADLEAPKAALVARSVLNTLFVPPAAALLTQPEPAVAKEVQVGAPTRSRRRRGFNVSTEFLALFKGPLPHEVAAAMEALLNLQSEDAELVDEALLEEAGDAIGGIQDSVSEMQEEARGRASPSLALGA